MAKIIHPNFKVPQKKGKPRLSMKRNILFTLSQRMYDAIQARVKSDGLITENQVLARALEEYLKRELEAADRETEKT